MRYGSSSLEPPVDLHVLVTGVSPWPGDDFVLGSRRPAARIVEAPHVATGLVVSQVLGQVELDLGHRHSQLGAILGDRDHRGLRAGDARRRWDAGVRAPGLELAHGLRFLPWSWVGTTRSAHSGRPAGARCRGQLVARGSARRWPAASLSDVAAVSAGASDGPGAGAIRSYIRTSCGS